MNTEDEFEVVVPFMPRAKARLAWEMWLQAHDVSSLMDTDIRIDTGRGELDGRVCDMQAYRVRKTKLVQIKATGPKGR